MLIDTHAHIEKEEEVLAAAKSGVTKIINIGTDLEDSKKAIAFAQKFAGVFATTGIHPHNKCDDWEAFEAIARSPKVVAIGECGLDYSEISNKIEEGRQIDLFNQQIDVAKKLNLPLVIHSRDATDKTLEILRQVQDDKLKGVFHFYSFGKSKIKTVLDMGFYFGVDGNLTYDSGIQNVVKEISLERILLETDSPYLAPVPFRGSTNSPANVKIIAEFLAKLKNISLEEVADVTSKNARKLFSI